MHYKSEKKHGKKNSKPPKRMKGQESFIDDSLNAIQYDSRSMRRNPDNDSESSRTPKRMKTDASGNTGSHYRSEQADDRWTSPKHIALDEHQQDKKQEPKRIKHEDPLSNYRNTRSIDFEGEDNKQKKFDYSERVHNEENYGNSRSSAESQNKYVYQRREKPVKRNQSKKRISGAWIILICLGFMTIVSLLAWDIFKISSVEINGLVNIAYADVIALSGIKFNQSIFLTDYETIKKNIETNPMLEVTDVRKTLPSTIIIDISERKAVAVISYIGKTIIIDKDCNVVGISDGTAATPVLVVKGVEIKDYTLGREIVLSDSKKLDALKELLVAFERNNSSQYISEIDLTNIGYIVLKSTMGLKITIGGTQNLDNKCNWINTKVPEFHNNNQTTGTFHITDINTASYEPGQ